jgi:hypothetical protein
MEQIQAKCIMSPGRHRKAELFQTAGAAWEYSSATLSLAGLPFGPRRFRLHGVWSSCSRYFAISEWRSTCHIDGPDMHLLVIDVTEWRECVVERANAGFIDPLNIHGGAIKYSIKTPEIGEHVVRMRRIDELTGWRSISGELPDPIQEQSARR